MARPRRNVEVSRDGNVCRGRFFAMGSPCEVLVADGDMALGQQLTVTAAQEAWRIEDKFSRYLPGNIVAAINESNGHPVVVDDETAGLLDFAATLHELSDGRFDITSGVLRRAWTFDGSDRVPPQELLDDLRQIIGWHRVSWRRPELSMTPGMQIDLGGIGKEYAVDRAALLITERSTTSCLLNFGGDLVVAGEPHRWTVGIESVEPDELGPGTRLGLTSGALATSGDARRYVTGNGRRYGHILDPTTGWPVENAPRSITVAADTCTQAGMLATLAMLRGADAENWLTGESVRFWSLR